MNALADAFVKDQASSLGIDPPAIFWFEAADFQQAKQAWLECPCEKRNAAADPLLQHCDYFRWSGRPGFAFYGYTHRESPLGIMINVCRSGPGLLETIAEECFHLGQDLRHGVDWRSESGTFTVEEEARAFVISHEDERRRFLKHWEETQP
jgi:hypothetical protein